MSWQKQKNKQDYKICPSSCLIKSIKEKSLGQANLDTLYHDILSWISQTIWICDPCIQFLKNHEHFVKIMQNINKAKKQKGLNYINASKIIKRNIHQIFSQLIPPKQCPQLNRSNSKPIDQVSQREIIVIKQEQEQIIVIDD